MTSTALYELAPEYRRFLDVLYESADENGVIPPEAMETLKLITGRYEEKVEQCCAALAELSGTADIFKAEEKRISDRRKSLEARAAWLKQYIFDALVIAGRTSADKALEAGTWKLKICNSPPKLELYDENAVPTDYDEMPERKINNKAVKDAIAAGVNVPGARITAGTFLKIS